MGKQYFHLHKDVERLEDGKLWLVTGIDYDTLAVLSISFEHVLSVHLYALFFCIYNYRL